MYLNCHSYFSLKYGTISIQNLISKASDTGIKCMALTDINNSSGVFDFVKACHAFQIKPIVGIEFRNGDELKYICLAKNSEGFREINDFLTDFLMKEKPFPSKTPAYKHAFTIYPINYLETNPTLSESEWVGVRFWEIPKIYRYMKSKSYPRLIAIHTFTFTDKIYFNLHRLLRAIDLNTLLSKLPKHSEAHTSEWMIEESKLLNYFKGYEPLIERTNQIMAQCHFEFDYSIPKNKSIFTNSTDDDFMLLKKLALDGMKYRYGENNKTALTRVYSDRY